MQPKETSYWLLGLAREKEKFFEFGVSEDNHPDLPRDPAELLILSIGMLGRLAADIGREETDVEWKLEPPSELLFVARFLDSYLGSRLDEQLDVYLALLGAASYYLCGRPGSASVMASKVTMSNLDLNGEGLEHLLLWLLPSRITHSDEWMSKAEHQASMYRMHIDAVIDTVRWDGDGDIDESRIAELSRKLIGFALENGTPRQFLLALLVGAIVRLKWRNSAKVSLPSYSDISYKDWSAALSKPDAIEELWPSQHQLGTGGAYGGQSVVAQMSTSAGKTRAMELIIRSAFIANRAKFAVVISPFRALCQETANDLGDTFIGEDINIETLSLTPQIDFKEFGDPMRKNILVMTPEKLHYIIRHDPSLAEQIGVLIFDEGHMFGEGLRGINYELLLTTLLAPRRPSTQLVLLSAVMGNATKIGEWISQSPTFIHGSQFSPTFRSIGFVSWQDSVGNVEYVNSRNRAKGAFSVLGVVKQQELSLRRRERKKRYFPDREDSQAIALYLGLRLVKEGGVAIFCGMRRSAATICEKFIDGFERGLPLPTPKDCSDTREIDRLTALCAENVGVDSIMAKCAAQGILVHHGDVPHGIRLSVEFAMRQGLVRFIICTSTLGQGVNLPIRYLIVSSHRQGKEACSVRDFQNLMGRTARAGMHTEGSVLFANPQIYDEWRRNQGGWQWQEIDGLLDHSAIEDCGSSILDLVHSRIWNDPGKSVDNESESRPLDILQFVDHYVQGKAGLYEMARELDRAYRSRGFMPEVILPQLEDIGRKLAAIESFLMFNWGQNTKEAPGNQAKRWCEKTLAFELASEDESSVLVSLFARLGENIEYRIDDGEQGKVYGKVFYGLNDTLDVEGNVTARISQLVQLTNDEQILDEMWDLFEQRVYNNAFNKFSDVSVLRNMVKQWIGGIAFHEMLEGASKCRIGLGQRPRKVTIDNIVDICENAFAYDGSLFVGALCDLLDSQKYGDIGELKVRLRRCQRRIRYGLPSETSIGLYELGLSDRVVAQDLEEELGLVEVDKKQLVEELKGKSDAAVQAIDKYPMYFRDRMDKLLDQR